MVVEFHIGNLYGFFFAGIHIASSKTSYKLLSIQLLNWCGKNVTYS